MGQTALGKNLGVGRWGPNQTATRSRESDLNVKMSERSCRRRSVQADQEHDADELTGEGAATGLRRPQTGSPLISADDPIDKPR